MRIRIYKLKEQSGSPQSKARSAYRPRDVRQGGKRINQRRWRVLKGLAPKYHHEAHLNRSSVQTTNGETQRGRYRIRVLHHGVPSCLLCLLAPASPEYSTAFPHMAHGHDARACTRASVYRVYKQPPTTAWHFSAETVAS